MRSGYDTGRASLLLKTPSVREQAGRRWLTIVCVLLALALVSGVVGSLTPSGSDHPAAEPFSYFPT